MEERHCAAVAQAPACPANRAVEKERQQETHHQGLTGRADEDQDRKKPQDKDDRAQVTTEGRPRCGVGGWQSGGSYGHFNLLVSSRWASSRKGHSRMRADVQPGPV